MRKIEKSWLVIVLAITTLAVSLMVAPAFAGPATRKGDVGKWPKPNRLRNHDQPRDGVILDIDYSIIDPDAYSEIIKIKPDPYVTIPNPSLTVTDINPDRAAQGESVWADVYGLGFESKEGEQPTVNLRKGSDAIKATVVEVKSRMWIHCRLVIPSDARLGLWDIEVINPNGAEGTLEDGLEIIVAYPPTVESIAPQQAELEETVEATIEGRSFLEGATVKLVREQEIIARNVNVGSRTRITCNLTIPRNAHLGNWDVVVINPDGQSGTLYGGFTIENPSPQVDSISQEQARRGWRNKIWINGDWFQEDADVIISKDGFRLDVKDEAVFPDGKTIECYLTVQDNAPTGFYDVIVINPDGKSGTLENGFEVL